LDIKTCLGSSLSDFAPRLLRLSEDPICPLNPCGEGGEFETFTFDCPLFRHRIVPTQQPTTIMHSDDAFAPVAYLNYGGLALQTKDLKEVKTSAEELLAMETEIDVGSGSLCRRPFRSIRHRLLALASEVPQEVSQRLVSCDSAPPLTTAARPPPSQKAPPGTRPLGGCLFMTQTFTGVAALPSSGDVRGSITKATQSALNRMQRHLALNQPFEAAFDTPEILRQRAGNVPPSRVCVATQWPGEMINLLRSNEQYSNRGKEQEVTPEHENTVIISVSAVVLPPNTETASATVTGMRVRSFSHWAPAVIGPYSQAVRVRVNCLDEDEDDCAGRPGPLCSVFYAGQIGLIPETGSLPEMCVVHPQTGNDQGPYAQQGWLSLRHVHRILEVSVYFSVQPWDPINTLLLSVCVCWRIV
uniref:Diphthami_syn_2 domain-containing protein n=1 Tax=Schistocephalus solidus TaxID=70667 RepID=A0A183S9Y3_SCHSO